MREIIVLNNAGFMFIKSAHQLILKIKFTGVCIFLSPVLFISCEHDPIIPPLPVEVSFKNDIAPIMNSYCTYSGCHNSKNNINFPLETYYDVVTYGQVVAYKPLESDLYDVISRGYMPFGDTLSKVQQKIIYDWIQKGAIDN